MEFFSHSSYLRPIRSKESTRTFAFESLNRKYGLEALKTPYVDIDKRDGFWEISPIERQDIAIRTVAEKAPIRICDHEKISGSATLGYAFNINGQLNHCIPALYDGKIVCGAVSHLTIDFFTVVKKGLLEIEKNIYISLERHKGTEREPFLKSCISFIDSFRIWHKRYLDALKTDSNLIDNYNNLLHVPFEGATTFYEAVQSLWFVFAFVRLLGNWPGIGRIDLLLGDYLKNDLQNGTITIDEAREILAHFFIKGCEWICGDNYGSGDAQHYQNLVIAGVDENGNEVTNEVTYLVLDIIEEFGIGDFPTTVRLNKNSAPNLLKRVAEVMRYGGGALAIYNEDLIIEALVEYGYQLKEARSFANDGCWEVQIPGKTFFIYRPFDSLKILQENTLKNYDGLISYDSFNELFEQYMDDIRKETKEVCFSQLPLFEDDDPFKWKKNMPCTPVSLFEIGCIEKGLSYLEGGPLYNVFSPHIGGVADSVNSLYVIKKLVFDNKIISLQDLFEALNNNWKGYEELRSYIKKNFLFYGNDNDEVDQIYSAVLNRFSDICKEFDNICGYKFPSGVSTFGRQIEWATARKASPHGTFTEDILAGNCSPTPGTDTEGATAIIRSYCKADLKKQVTGAALDLKLLARNLLGEAGINGLVSLFRGFLICGGYFMQPDVVNYKALEEAQITPEKYKTLSVRVSGWNARFITLSKEWQQMIINESKYGNNK